METTKYVELIAVTPNGESCLRLMKAKTDIPFRDRFLYRRMYNEKVVSESPYTLRITPSPAFATRILVRDFIKILEEELSRRGAKNDIDYTIDGE